MPKWILRCLAVSFAWLVATAVLAQAGPPGFVAEVDLPDPNIPESEIVLVRGFAYDVQGLTRIEVFADGVFQGDARLGFPRIDAIERYATQYPGIQNAAPGFHGSFPATHFSKGRHSISLRARTGKGQWIEFGRRTIYIDNTVKHGFLDIPDPGGIARITALLVAATIFVSAIAAPSRREN